MKLCVTEPDFLNNKKKKKKKRTKIWENGPPKIAPKQVILSLLKKLVINCYLSCYVMKIYNNKKNHFKKY